MRNQAPISDAVTVHVPFRIVKRGGRKEMVFPANAPTQRRTDNTIIKALASLEAHARSWRIHHHG